MDSINYQVILPADCVTNIFSFLNLDLNEFCKISLVSKQWSESFKTSCAWINKDYHALPERIKKINWLTPREQLKQNYNELKEKISAALEYCEMKNETIYTMFDADVIQNLKGTEYSLHRKVNEIIEVAATKFMNQIFYNNHIPIMRVHEQFIRCIRMGFQPKIDHLNDINTQTPGLLDIILTFIESGVNVNSFGKFNNSKNIFERIYESNRFSRNKVLEIEELAITHLWVNSLKEDPQEIQDDKFLSKVVNNYVKRLLKNEHTLLTLKEKLIKCFEWGYRPQPYHLLWLNMNHPQLFDLIIFFIELKVDCFDKNNENNKKSKKNIFDRLYEGSCLTENEVLKLEELAITNFWLDSLKEGQKAIQHVNILPKIFHYVFRLIQSNLSPLTVKEKLKNCLEWGCRPQPYHIHNQNMEHHELLDLIIFFIESGVNVNDFRHKQRENIFECLYESKLFSKNEVLELEELAITNNPKR